MWASDGWKVFHKLVFFCPVVLASANSFGVMGRDFEMVHHLRRVYVYEFPS